MTISKITLEKNQYPLFKPYNLSFAKLDYFTSLQVHIESNLGQVRSAEVVPLFGYNEETEEEIEKYLKAKITELLGCEMYLARQKISQDIDRIPFSTSPLLTAIDLFEYGHLLDTNLEADFVVPTSTKEPSQLHRTIIENKETPVTIKIKLSDNVEHDVSVLKSIENECSSKKIRLRLDANQALNLTDATKMFDFLSKSRLLKVLDYVEQPLKSEDWEGHKILRDNYNEVGLMLDESIINEKDVIKAKEIGVPFIKLKLFKQGGIKEVISLAELAYLHKINVVFGNGVATEISNRVEIGIYKEHHNLFYGASEANGFCKVKI